MSDQISGLYAITKPVLMAFPNLFEPKAFMENGKARGEPKYSANFVFDPADNADDLKNMKALVAKIARANTQVAFTELALPFVSGDKLAEAAKAKKKNGEYQRGKVVVAARSKFQPKLAVFENGKAVDLDDSMFARYKSRFYPGVRAFAQFNFVWHAVGSNKSGVTAYLNLVLTTGKGDRIAGGKPAAEVFAGYVGHVTDTDPTAGQSLDDEIPF